MKKVGKYKNGDILYKADKGNVLYHVDRPWDGRIFLPGKESDIRECTESEYHDIWKKSLDDNPFVGHLRNFAKKK